MSLYTLFDSDKVFVLGHRGFSEEYPENTMLSFSKCAEAPGIDGVELDVHLCKSGEVVVAHDGNLMRTAGIDKYIEDMTWEELKDIDVGSFKGSKFSSCRMCLLSELFEEFGSRFIYDIELKVQKGRKYKKLCEKVWDLITFHQLEERVMVSSFSPFALKFFNKVCMMSVPTADIFCEGDSVPGILRHGWGYHISQSSFSKPEYTIVDQNYADKMGRDLIVWTVNTADDAEKMLKIKGIKGLIGNNPALLADIRTRILKK